MSSITQSVTPPVAGPAQKLDFSEAKVNDMTGKNTIEDTKKTDFRTLITNSMDEIQKERKAKENGDLTSSSDAEFLDKLSSKSQEKRTPKNELGKDDFLKLFVTQMQHQDPMNPDDGAEMASKLAQFNGLEQMMNMNKGIEKLIAAQGSDHNTQMINYIGKEVTVDGGRVQLKNGKPTTSEFNTSVPIAASTLEVRDSAGILINQVEQGSMDAGTHALKWDGTTQDGRPAGDGIYTYTVNARNMDGENVPIALTSKARINGVDIKDKNGALFSDFGRVTFDQIRSVGKVGYDSVDIPKTGLAEGAAPAAQGMMASETTIPLPGTAPTSAAAASVAAPLPLPPTAAKAKAPASDSLDKLQAQGKLEIKKPDAKSATAQIQAKEAAQSADQRAGASAKDSAAKIPVDPAAASSAKLMETETEKSPQTAAS